MMMQLSQKLAAGLGALLLLSSCRAGAPRTQPGQTAKPGTTTTPSQALESFQRVPGTPYLVAAIVDGTSRKTSSSSYAGAGSTRNLVFLESGSLASHRLFPTNEFVIVESKQYSGPSSDAQQEQPPKTRWFGYRVLTEDTNGNGYFDADDHQSFGISAASGKDYSVVLTGISTWLGSTEIEPGRLVVVYEQDGQKTASLVDLEQRKVLKRQRLTSLGEEVK